MRSRRTSRAVPLVLTIAAGMRCADLSRWLGGYPRIVRAMPNTPALVGAGISALYAMPEARRTRARRRAGARSRAARSCGVEREDDLDAVTGVSGSGPAYVFYFLEALEQAAIELGLRRRRCTPPRVRDVRRQRAARAGKQRSAGARCART